MNMKSKDVKFLDRQQENKDICKSSQERNNRYSSGSESIL